MAEVEPYIATDWDIEKSWLKNPIGCVLCDVLNNQRFGLRAGDVPFQSLDSDQIVPIVPEKRLDCLWAATSIQIASTRSGTKHTREFRHVLYVF